MAKFKKILQSENNHTVGILSDTDSPGASVEALLDVHFPGSIPTKIVERDDHQFDGWTTEESVTNNNHPSSNFINTNIKSYLIEEGSKVLGLKNIIFIDDVESKLYGNIYGKSSK